MTLLNIFLLFCFVSNINGYLFHPFYKKNCKLILTSSNNNQLTHQNTLNAKSALNDNVPSSVKDNNINNLKQKAKILSLTLASIATLPSISNAKSEYLVEPTAEFNKEVAKTSALREKQEKVVKKWYSTLEKFSNTEDSSILASSLKELKVILEEIQEIPSGVKRKELVKTCRTKKFIPGSKKKQPYWTKQVEIAYEDLIMEYNKQTNPDTRRGVEPVD